MDKSEETKSRFSDKVFIETQDINRKAEFHQLVRTFIVPEIDKTGKF